MSIILTPAQMRAVEEAAIASGQASGPEMMERGGQAVVGAILTELAARRLANTYGHRRLFEARAVFWAGVHSTAASDGARLAARAALRIGARQVMRGWSAFLVI